MSTEHQQYSLANQAATNLVYAEQHHFEIVRTYSDAARSGIYLKHREGLRQLLQDSVSGTCEFKAILVYDVSRWGRFQDSDESAHYEFLCKAAGVPVYYCAEGFDGVEARFVNISKSLKRTMAGEYSRELSVKVYEAQKRIAQMGYKNGGPPGYGLRRLAVDAQLQPKRLLASGERKSFPTDRVVLTPGPPQEVAIVQEIFRLFTEEKWSVTEIVT